MTDKNLIFLISQPRSGSTLTQKILGAHTDIYTRSEPWIMLHPLYALKDRGIHAEYNKTLDYRATQDFINDLPDGGRSKYLAYIRYAYLSMYNDYLTLNNKNIFLDKTPRYHLIMDELKEVFPQAKQILLVRNPLAVLSSIIKTFTKENFQRLSDFKIDLIDGLDIIVNKLERDPTDLYLLRYESLVSYPTETLMECFEYLNIEFDPNIMNYHNTKSEKWKFGDPDSVYKKEGIDATNDLQWIHTLNDPQHWRVIYDYLHYIGDVKFKVLGYDFEKFNTLLLEKMPASSMAELNEQTIALLELLKSSEVKKDILIKEIKLQVRSLQSENTFLQEKLGEMQKGKQDVFSKITDMFFQRNK